MQAKAPVMGLALVVGLLLLSTSAQAQSDFVRGDVNCDGKVTGADTTALMAHLFMGQPIQCRDAADVNDNGDVTSLDVVYLVNFLAKGQAAPLPPYPDCGSDPTPDGLGCANECCPSGWDCPITMSGDCNQDGFINSSDVIGMVNFVFKSGDAPLPCVASADVNCNAMVTSSDIIYSVNYVFKSGDPPCDVCGIMPEAWGEECP